jgi:hypothetical protein
MIMKVIIIIIIIIIRRRRRRRRREGKRILAKMSTVTYFYENLGIFR